MADTFDSDEVQTTFELSDVAGDLVTVDFVLDLPLRPGLEHLPIESVDPPLGSISRHHTIGVARVVHHLNVFLQHPVDPLRSLILLGVLPALDRAAVAPGDVRLNVQSRLDIGHVHVLLQSDWIVVGWLLLLPVDLVVLESSTEPGIVLGSIVDTLERLMGRVAWNSAVHGQVVLVEVVGIESGRHVQSGVVVGSTGIGQLGWVHRVVEVASGSSNLIVEILWNHVEAVERVSPRALGIVLPVGDSIANHEALQVVQHHTRVVLLDLLLKISLVELPRQVRHIDAAIRLS